MSSRNRYLRLQLALRGLIGNGPLLDPYLEDVRTEILCIGVEHENTIKINHAVANLFGSMEQHESGGINPGQLTDLRQTVTVEYIESLAPYRDFSSWKGNQDTDPNSEREKFLQEYKEWANEGKSVESSAIECTLGDEPDKRTT